MSKLHDVLQLRVRYSETDQMGTFYNSRALEWFECGRTELMRRRLGMSYAALETKGVFLPLVEAHLEFQGGARYDDLLERRDRRRIVRARPNFDLMFKSPRAQTGKPGRARLHRSRLCRRRRQADPPAGVVRGTDPKSRGHGHPEE